MTLEFAQEYRLLIRNLQIDHREYLRVKNEVYAQLAFAKPGTITMIVGPTRCGKTTIREAVQGELVRTELGDSRHIPSITIEAASTIDGYMSMKHFTVCGMMEIKHPYILNAATLDEHGRYLPRLKASESVLRVMFEKGLVERHTKFMHVDEAHHLTRTRSEKRAGEALDTLKNIGNTTGLIIVLWGGVELLRVGMASAHLNGRMRVIVFPPYYIDVEEDIIEFARILELLDSVLPRAHNFSLLSYQQSIHAGSAGCVGLLLEWVDSALALMGARNQKQLTISHFRDSRIKAQLEMIEEEVKDARKLFESQEINKSLDDRIAQSFKPRRQKAPHKPFTRKPGRDPVGGPA